jgi:hypothetical protein
MLIFFKHVLHIGRISLRGVRMQITVLSCPHIPCRSIPVNPLMISNEIMRRTQKSVTFLGGNKFEIPSAEVSDLETLNHSGWDVQSN